MPDAHAGRQEDRPSAATRRNPPDECQTVDRLFDSDPDLGRIEISLSLEDLQSDAVDQDPTSLTSPAQTSAQTVEQLNEAIEKHAKQRVSLQNREGYYHRLTQRLESLVPAKPSEKDEKQEEISNAVFFGMIGLVSFGGAVLSSAVSLAGSAIIQNIFDIPDSSFPIGTIIKTAAIAGGILTWPAIFAGFWLKEERPFAPEYLEYRRVCKAIEKTAKEERLTAELKDNLYKEAVKHFQKVSRGISSQISSLNEQDAKVKAEIDRIVEEDRGKLPVRFENAKRRLGFSEGDLIPSPREQKEDSQKLWKD